MGDITVVRQMRPEYSCDRGCEGVCLALSCPVTTYSPCKNSSFSIVCDFYLLWTSSTINIYFYSFEKIHQSLARMSEKVDVLVFGLGA